MKVNKSDMGSEAIALLSRMPGTRVLCIGDVMLDRYVYGEANRISPEAPVPVVHVKRQVLIPGGVGNVVTNLAELGIFPLALSVVGNDTNADSLAGFLSGKGNASLTLVRDEARPTIVKTRILAGIQQVVRFDEEVLTPLSDAVTDKLIGIAEKLIGEAKSVAMSDYGKGVVNPRLTQAIIKMATARGCPVAIDPKGFDYAKYAGADLLKPNRKELGEAVGDIITDENKAAEAGRALMRKYGIKNVLVTLSDKGMLLLREEDGGERPVLLPSKAKEVYDVTGAGDTVLAGIAASMAIGAPLHLGARLATLAAGVVVGKVGTAVARIDEIEKAALKEPEAR